MVRTQSLGRQAAKGASPRQLDKPLAGQAGVPSSDASERSRFDRAAASWLR